jgi:hypothetical protein
MEKEPDQPAPIEPVEPSKGRPALDFDWPVLDAMLQFKVTKKFCADYLGVSEDTIDRRIKDKHNMKFSDYHELKMSRTGLKLQQKAIEMALKGNTTMMIFSLKNLAKWSDNVDIGVSGPIQVVLPDGRAAKL